MNAPLARDAAEAVDAARFRAAFRRLVGGVTVITTGTGHTRTGLTATSVSAFSAEPAALTFNLARASSTWAVLESERRFGVNILAAEQQAIAERFSGFGGLKGAERYAGAEWTTAVTGAPLLVGALTALDCEVEEAIERHGHVLVIGRIRAALIGTSAVDPALIYAHGRYGGA
jgi:flavin reductase (DIM6/NTAB) family NADH-FMN oxidoreductase RutF